MTDPVLEEDRALLARVESKRMRLGDISALEDELAARVEFLSAAHRRCEDRVEYYESMRTFPRGKALAEIRAALAPATGADDAGR